MPLKAASTAKRTPQGSDAPPHTPSPPPSNPTMSDRSPARPTNGEAHAAKDDQIPTATSTSVNRKKQKRRQKQAARLAAENHHLHNGYASIDVANNAGPRDEQDLDDVEPHDSVNGDLYSDEDHDSLDAYHGVLSPSGLSHSHQAASSRISRKKKGKKGRSDSQTIADGSSTPRSTPSISMSHAFPSSFPSHFGPRAILRSAKERNVWNTSTQEERENIKTFWLELGEEERRQLVKVEKDAVLKKMKEQQKHSCSCTVCGRKRTAIEEELEVLYDAYYEELEQYANNNQGSFEKTSPIVPPPRLYHPPLRSPGQHTRTHGQFHPSRGRVHELPEEEEEEEEDLEEEYDEEEEEEDEPYSDEEEDDDLEDEDTRAARADFFAFGNSLTVKDGILTVADDLLKNDGKHFIDMMEQLAERRMQREEDTQYGIAAAHESLHSGHNHGPLDEEDYDDEEEDDEDYDSQEEEDYEEDEMDAMTEEQRMEEGRRMFQIFAARMFEQRVLTAYREKVAEQRQQKLIEELMEEETRNEQRSVKKARESQKKKDKKRLQRQAKEEEKARRDSEKAAEEAAAKAAQEKKLEEQRQKREEQRKKREAERKAQEEERARKEAEKQRRLQEERDRQAEAERKHREKKEQEKQRREEAQRKEAEEQEAREKKAKEDRENKAREDELRKKSEQQDPKARDAQTAKRVSQPNIPIPSNLPHPQGPSPYSQVATPMVPKAPTPVRPRQPSFQDSHASSPRSQTASAEQSQVSVSPRSMPQSQSSGASSATSKQGLGHHPMLQHPPPPTPLSPLGSAARSHPPGLFGANGFPSHHPPGLSGMAPRQPMASDLPGYPPHTSSLMSPLRGFPATNGIHAPPGINGTHGARPMPPGRGFPLDPGHGLSSFHGQQPINNPFSPPQGGLSQARHSRQASGSFERSPLNTHAQPSPISRPSPIKRTSSTAPQDHQRDNGRTTTQQDVDELSTHLGSSALLDGTDALFNSNLSQSLPGATAPGSFRQPTRASFGAPSPFPDPLSLPKHPSFSVHPSGVGSSFNITWDDPYKK